MSSVVDICNIALSRLGDRATVTSIDPPEGSAQADHCRRFYPIALKTILAAYKDFEDRMALVETKLPALEMVRRASKNRIGRFNKQDIRELCPTLSDSSIEGALRKLVAAGELKKEGKGKNTCYFRLN